MVVDVIGIEMGSNNYLVIITPHPFCRFQPDFVRFFWRDFAGYKTLIPVIGDIPAELAVPPFSCHHTLVGSLLRAVDTRYIHCLVGLLIVLDIAERRPQIFVQELFIGGLVGIFRIVDHFL